MTSRLPSASLLAGTYAPGVLTLDIPVLTPSPNTYNGAHWGRYRKLRKLWSWYVKAAVLEVKCGALLWERSRVLVTRVSRYRLDPDNAMASLKVLCDALRDSEVIVNDTPEHITLEVHQVIGRPSHTIVEVAKL